MPERHFQIASRRRERGGLKPGQKKGDSQRGKKGPGANISAKGGVTTLDLQSKERKTQLYASVREKKMGELTTKTPAQIVFLKGGSFYSEGDRQERLFPGLRDAVASWAFAALIPFASEKGVAKPGKKGGLTTIGGGGRGCADAGKGKAYRSKGAAVGFFFFSPEAHYQGREKGGGAICRARGEASIKGFERNLGTQFVKMKGERVIKVATGGGKWK